MKEKKVKETETKERQKNKMEKKVKERETKERQKNKELQE
jgi:hypothetical protein